MSNLCKMPKFVCTYICWVTVMPQIVKNGREKKWEKVGKKVEKRGKKVLFLYHHSQARTCHRTWSLYRQTLFAYFSGYIFHWNTPRFLNKYRFFVSRTWHGKSSPDKHWIWTLLRKACLFIEKTEESLSNMLVFFVSNYRCTTNAYISYTLHTTFFCEWRTYCVQWPFSIWACDKKEKKWT